MAGSLRLSLGSISTLGILLLAGCGDEQPACPQGSLPRGGQCLTDSDDDGIADIEDNCPDAFNPGQEDADADGEGDECELADEDGDSVADAEDNCPGAFNPGQEDADWDGLGDACDPQPYPDADQDGVPDAEDNCPVQPNPDQADSDADGLGDACDTPDTDVDTVRDYRDNCPLVQNPSQSDLDGDGEGDACEAQDGSQLQPFIISCEPGGCTYNDARSTAASPYDDIDAYPPYSQDESGPEYVYVLRLYETSDLHAWIATPEPSGVDVDLHLLSTLSPPATLARNDKDVTMRLEAGVYYLVLDTYVSDGVEKPGAYELSVTVEPAFTGTPEAPRWLGGQVAAPLALPFIYTDLRDTRGATSDVIDTYPPYPANESGPEYVYAFTVDDEVRLTASLAAPEPAGVDVDVHVLSALSPPVTLARDHTRVHLVLGPGTYYLSLDTYGGEANAGRYALDVAITSTTYDPADYFNDYLLAAVDALYDNYALLGYDSAVLTHDIDYGTYGVIRATGGARTMCVAAVMEVILTAMQLYEEDTGDASVWNHLPKSSWDYLGRENIRGHLWVDFDLEAWGSADALRHFGMGQLVPFEQLVPGSLVNVNRTTGTGHAVVFLSFIDIEGNEYAAHNPNVVGFKYFSSQGGYSAGRGGLDYRYAVFADYGAPSMPYLRDLNIIYASDFYLLHTGMMLHPRHWGPSSFQLGLVSRALLPPELCDTSLPQPSGG